MLFLTLYLFPISLAIIFVASLDSPADIQVDLALANKEVRNSSGLLPTTFAIRNIHRGLPIGPSQWELIDWRGHWAMPMRNCDESSSPNKWFSDERILRFCTAPDGRAPDIGEATRSGIRKRLAIKAMYLDWHLRGAFKEADTHTNIRCDEMGRPANVETNTSQAIRLEASYPREAWQEIMCNRSRLAMRGEENGSLIALAAAVFLAVVLL